MAFYRAVAGGGSSPIKTGTITTVMTSGETKAINTGLSTIKKFTLVGWMTTSTNTRSAQCVVYNKDYSSNTYSSFEITSPTTSNGSVGGYGGTTLSFGAATIASFSISSISDGTVTIKAPTAVQYSTRTISYDLFWYAE